MLVIRNYLEKLHLDGNLIQCNYKTCAHFERASNICYVHSSVPARWLIVRNSSQAIVL